MAQKSPSLEFDPLAVENIGVTLAVELLEQPVWRMPPEVFAGAGVYALYYTGSHPAYADLVRIDQGRHKFPLYIGKAVAQNAKQGFSPAGGAGKKLYDRIHNHAKSINQASNLELDDFRCRFLVLNDAYITLAESVMIRLFRPAWNGTSFVSNVVGKNRIDGDVGIWDALHPGRGGRPSGTERESVATELISKRIAELSEPIKDPQVQRMHDRVMRFV
ncbi:Eco29kI family restriction endonuclease [Hyphomonas sp.]|uniref:Eco29kI family restriction endonuclease n=1 Tax=Hyphomonas sp. TaxID=87 RepID=UPI00391D3605